MKICVISSTVFPLHRYGGLCGYGGLEIIAWQVAKGLAEKGHQVSLVAPDGSECPGVEIIPIGVAGQIDEAMAFGGYPEIVDEVKDDKGNVLQKILRRRKHGGYWQHLLQQDVIISHDWQKHAYLLKMEGRLKAPVLGVMHAPVRTMFKFLPPVEKPCFVCISEDQRQDFEGCFQVSARTSYNGISLEHYRPVHIPRTRRFLFLARFSRIKGPDIAIRACQETRSELDLVGDTSITNEPEYFAQCKAQCDGKRIRMVGPATRGNCVWWFSQAHALLHSAQTFREPFGLSPCEGMACGSPVMCFDHGALRETVVHGQTGYIAKTYDDFVMNMLLFNEKSEKEQQVMRDNCLEHVKKFTVEKMVNRYEELCEEAIQTGGW